MNKNANKKHIHSKDFSKSKRRASPEANADSFSKILKSALIGFSVSLAAITALLFIGSAISYASEDPNSLTNLIGIIILIFSSFFGGLISATINRSKALLCGITTGILMNVFSLFLGIFTLGEKNDFSFPISLLLRCAVILCSILGALIASNARTNRKARRR